MELLTSGSSQQSYRIGPALSNLGESFYRGFVSSHEVTLRLATCDNMAAIASLQTEAALIERLSHRRIATLLDQGWTDKYFFLVLDGPAEGSLAEFITEAHFGVTASLDVLLQILEIVEILHHHGLAWGRLRPHAFWVDRSGKLKLMNLRGIGETAVSEPFTLTEAAYLPPEHSSGKSPTIASDMYSWGVIAYELLTGRTPFVGSNVAELAIKHLSDEPEDLARIRPDLPEEFVTLVKRCLAKKPEERPSSVVELRNELIPIQEQLLLHEQSQMIVCPRCHGEILPAERCPLCNAPLSSISTNEPAPQRRRSIPKPLSITLKVAGFCLIIGIIVLGQMVGDPESAPNPAQGQDSIAQVENTEPIPTSVPTPLPTATAEPLPEGTLTFAAADVPDPNIDVIRVRTAIEGDQLLTEVVVVGQISDQLNEATYQVFLDTDGSTDTGNRNTPWSNLGADYTLLYRSGYESATLLQWSNDTWQSVGVATTYIDGGVLSIQISSEWLGNLQELRYAVLTNNYGANIADYAPSPDDNPAVAAMASSQ